MLETEREGRTAARVAQVSEEEEEREAGAITVSLGDERENLGMSNMSNNGLNHLAMYSKIHGGGEYENIPTNAKGSRSQAPHPVVIKDSKRTSM
ncbi:hypothetical protein HAX54_033981 [Datura stramonium]|uniref:Uncharacterized protein n=1 Tax=Datura stramonium TaxID=4076 RepID=A0ABS8VET7_DATST|nr:hypothetical protein [Datura stramonium]